MLKNKYFQVIGGFVAIVFGVLQGIDWLFNKYQIDSFYFNMILIFILISFLVTLVYYLIKKVNQKSDKIYKSKILFGIVSSLLLLAIFNYFYNKINNNQNLINETIPQIINLYDEGEINKVFSILNELNKNFPDNEIINSYLDKSSRYAYLKSNIEGIDVSIKYGDDSVYNFLGKTPLDSFRVPYSRNSHILKLVHNGIEYLQKPRLNHNYKFPDKTINIPEGHKVFLGSNARMFLQGINFKEINLNPFSISKNEVTNKEYQKFMDSGGYDNPSYWDFPFEIDGVIYDFNSSIQKFTDKYGKKGPSNWSYGKFPSGLDNHPVTGISWFEARAYAKYSNLSLPNVYQWLYSSGISDRENVFVINQSISEQSNYNSIQTRPVDNSLGSYNELNNIGGNVKEWATNPYGNKKTKFSILGGSYLEPSYTFNNYYSQSPFDRSLGNGIRLLKNLTNEVSKFDNEIIPEFQRDFSKLSDVSDDVFEIFKNQFDYNDKPLNSTTTNLDGYQDGYTVQKFEMETTYESDEKLFGYIIYSNEFKNKYNPIIEFPNASSIGNNDDSFLPERLLNNFKYLIDEGYAIIHPIYHNTYSREKTHNTFWPDDSENYKNTIIKIGQDFRRSIDYIETRKDFNINNLSYFGGSWGSTTSNYLLAIDERVKSAFLLVGGLMMQKSKNEVEAHYYLRRIKTPILHIIGKLDGIFGYGESYLPWKDLVGTEPENLKTIEYDNFGHGIPKDTIIKYHQNWIEKYSTN